MKYPTRIRSLEQSMTMAKISLRCILKKVAVLVLEL